MIQPFVGEFLTHAGAIEIVGNHCSHNCAYCFAHTRGDGKIMKLHSVINRLKRTSPIVYLDWLLKLEYPIVFSNHTDPFSDNNYIQTNNLAYHLANIPNGIFIQTKGGKGIDEFIEIMGEKKNIVWYITITTDDDTARRTEPNALSTSERIALAKKLKSMGYLVVIGFVPAYPDWLPITNIDSIVKMFKSFGIKHFWFESLHINSKEFIHYSEKRKKSLGIDNVECLYGDKYREYLLQIVDIMLNNDCAFRTTGSPHGTSFHRDIAKALGGKSMPSNDDFLYYLKETYSEPKIIEFDEYYNFLLKGNEELFSMQFKDIPNNYILRYAFNLWKGNEKIQTINCFRDLLKLIWNNSDFRNCIGVNYMFRIVKKNEDDYDLDSEKNYKFYYNNQLNSFDEWEFIHNTREVQ